MVTFRSALRSYNATVRRIEREGRRREREAAKRFKEQQKFEATMEAASAVRNWKEYVEVIQSMHRDCTDVIDWHEIINSPEPERPEYCDKNERQVRDRIENFKPSLFDRLLLDRLFSSVEKKRNDLEALLVDAKAEDIKAHDSKLAEYTSVKSEWEHLQAMARGVLNRDTNKYRDAIEFFDPFSSLSMLGERINMHFDKNWVDVDVDVHSNDVIPDYTLSQTSTGKLSKKKMPKGAYYELYQDHVCSSALRIAREIFNYLPVDWVRVSSVSEILNSRTGLLEKIPILSVLIPKETLNKINLDAIDPSDSMDNFNHCMQFKKTEGFKPVGKIDLPK